MTRRTKPSLPTEATLSGLEWPSLMEALAGHLVTVYGQQAAARLAFLDDVESVRQSLARIVEMEALREEPGDLPFPGRSDVAELLERAEKKGRLEGAELRGILDTQLATRLLAARYREFEEGPLLGEVAEALLPEAALCDSLTRALTPAGDLSEQAYPALAKLRRELTRRRKAIHRRIEGLLRAPALKEVFQEPIYTLRNGRYVLPVKADFRGRVAGIVHDVSATGATLYIEPEPVLEENNAAILVEKQIEALIESILRELSAEVGASAPALRKNLEWLGRADLLHAQAALSRTYRGVAPEVREEGRIAVKGMAHPLMLIAGERVVRNDFALGESRRCMVISGANTGGKTVLLMSVGLSALLVRCGMPVPALAGSRFDLFPDVRADIGDRQNLGQSLSTFSAQIRFLAETLAGAGPGSLVLIDEMLTGTAPEEGAALASTTLERLSASGACCVVTTHYGELKALAAAHEGIVNASVSFDPERLRPTFHLIPGLPGASYAFPIARRHGLSEALTAAAQLRLADRPASADALLRELHGRERLLEEREQALAAREGEQAKASERLGGREAGLADRERTLRRRERGQIAEELKAARARIAEVIKRLQARNSLPMAGKAREQLRRLERELKAEEPEALPTAAKPQRLAPGDRVLVRSLNRVATVGAAAKDRVRITLGAISMEVSLADLAAPPDGPDAPQAATAPGAAKPEKGAASRKRRGKAASGGPPGTALVGVVIQTEENTQDVRGLRLEEALEQAEKFFDHCVMKHVSPVVLIHGHGMGKLKAGLRERCKASPYVAEFRPGEKGEGGDGVTVVALNL